MNRVVVTGMGAITPVGNDVDTFWNSLKQGTVGIGPITSFDTADYKVKLAAEVKDFDPKQYMDPKAARRMERFSQLAVAASKQALEDAGIDMEKEDPYRVGVCVSSGIGSLQAIEREYQKLLEKGPGRINPLLVPLMISNMAAGNVSIQFGLKGKSLNVVTACATGTHSIGEAMRAIQHGEAEVMVAGGTESSITPIGVAGFTSLTALSTAEDPLRASIPFDAERGGFVMGEGSGALVLEELEHAKARGAKIYAEVVGYGMSGDAYHITAPSGDGAYRAMKMAIDHAKEHGVELKDINYINAHGTSTPAGDVGEAEAVKRAFGEYATKVSMSSTKSAIGHLLGAAGAVEAVLTIMAIKEQTCPPTLNLHDVEDEVAEFDLVPLKAKKREIKAAMSNSFGFGGTNSSLVFKKYEA